MQKKVNQLKKLIKSNNNQKQIQKKKQKTILKNCKKIIITKNKYKKNTRQPKISTIQKK